MNLDTRLPLRDSDRRKPEPDGLVPAMCLLAGTLLLAAAAFKIFLK